MDRDAVEKADMRNRLLGKYEVRGEGMMVVKEEIKQRMKAKAAKVKRYDDRVGQYRQNSLFRSHQKCFLGIRWRGRCSLGGPGGS